MKMATDFYQYAEENGIQVATFPLPKIGSLSLQGENDVCYIGIDPSVLSQKEEKVRMAHECGHCKRGGFYSRHTPFDLKSRHEVRAEKWAIPALVSEDELYAAVAAGITEIWELAEYFDIPYPYMEKIVNFYEGNEWY